jgi:hypothetical protein
MSYQDHYNSSLRLGLLRLIREAPGESANASVLHLLVQEELGFVVLRDKVVNELRWLKDLSLIDLEDLGRNVQVATLTERGRFVAQGRIEVSGVAVPNKKG